MSGVRVGRRSEERVMRSKTSSSYNYKPVVESLEGRRLFSATPAGGVPFIGPMEAQEYAVSQAMVKTASVGDATTIDDAKTPTPKSVIFWAQHDTTPSPRIGGWLRAGSLLG